MNDPKRPEESSGGQAAEEPTPGSATPRNGEILWHDLTVPNAEAVRDFYASVVGWRTGGQSMGDYEDYNVFVSGTEDCIAGICHALGSNANMPPQWLMYVQVADVEECAQRCREQGGEVVDGPRPMAGSNFCVIRDPAGAVLALIEPAPSS